MENANLNSNVTILHIALPFWILHFRIKFPTDMLLCEGGIGKFTEARPKGE